MAKQNMADASERLHSWLLLAYSLPAVPIAALTLSLNVFIPNFYASEVGLSLTAVGVILFALRIFDAVIDPCIGYLCDKTKVSFGRRRIWFALAMPVTVLSGYMVFVPPVDATIMHLASWLFCLSISISALSLSYTAWGAELATSYEERNRVSAFREIGILTGTLVASVTPFLLQSVSEGSNAVNLLAIAVFIAFSMPLAAGLALWKVPEPVNRSSKTLDFKESLTALWQNKPFLRLIAAFVFNSFANSFPVTLFLFFVSDVLAAAQWRELLLLIYFICGMAGVPVWVKLSGRFGKHRTWCWGMIFACFVFSFAPFLGPGDAFAFAIITILTGLVLGADLVIPSSIQADVIDVDTAATGEQRSGLYFAAWSVATQLSLAAAVGVAFPILDLAGFDAARSGNLDPDAPGLFTLAVLYGWIPVLMKLIAIALMWSFPIDREMQEDLKRQIDAAAKSSTVTTA